MRNGVRMRTARIGSGERSSGPGQAVARALPRALLLALAVPILALSLYALRPTESDKPIDLLVDLETSRFGVVPGEFDYDATGPHGPVLSAGQPLWRTYVDEFAPSPKFVIIQAATLADERHYPL